MDAALRDLLDLLDLEHIDRDIFRGRSPDEGWQRDYGGQVIGQALVAASRTVSEPERLTHSLHGYFLRPGDTTIPILYDVDRIRDGKSFSTRRRSEELLRRRLRRLRPRCRGLCLLCCFWGRQWSGTFSRD